MLEKYFSKTDKAKIEDSIGKLIDKKEKNYLPRNVARSYYTFLSKIDEAAVDAYMKKLSSRTRLTKSGKQNQSKYNIIATDALRVYETNQKRGACIMFVGEILTNFEDRQMFPLKNKFMPNEFEEDEEVLPNIEDNYDL